VRGRKIADPVRGKIREKKMQKLKKKNGRGTKRRGTKIERNPDPDQGSKKGSPKRSTERRAARRKTDGPQKGKRRGARPSKVVVQMTHKYRKKCERSKGADPRPAKNSEKPPVATTKKRG